MTSDIVLDEQTIDIDADEVNCRPERGGSSQPTVKISPKHGNITLGGRGTDGDLLIDSKGNRRLIEISAEPNRDNADRRVYINGKDALLRLTAGSRARESVMSLKANSITCHQGFVRYQLAVNKAVFQVPLTVNKEAGSTKLSGHEIEVTSAEGERIRLVAEIKKLRRELEQLRSQVNG